jgi:hypothetical protein
MTFCLLPPVGCDEQHKLDAAAMEASWTVAEALLAY